MQVLPPALTNLIDAFASLPGVGPRTAERYANYVLKHGKIAGQQIADPLLDLHDNIAYCSKTYMFVPSGQELSALYTKQDRDKLTVAVVAEPFDVVAIEKTGQFKGTYHVLGGLVSPIDGVGPDSLHIPELVARIEDDGVKEVILATNASVEGESTALYIRQQLSDSPVRITRLAQGLPIGVDLEYADQITLGRALENRRVI